jgi:hypothetical protein
LLPRPRQSDASQLDSARAFVDQLLASAFAGLTVGDSRENALEVL